MIWLIILTLLVVAILIASADHHWPRYQMMRNRRRISFGRRLAIYLRDDFRCVYCFRDLRMAPRFEVTLDHVVCHSHGGSRTAGNLVASCLDCNVTRGNQPLSAFASAAVLTRIAAQLERPVLDSESARLSSIHSRPQDILGHASPETTKQVYAHYTPKFLTDAVEKYSASPAQLVAELHVDEHRRRRG